MPSNAKNTLNSYEVVATFHGGAQIEARTVVALVNEESQEAARGLVASIADQLGAGDLFAATVTPIPMHSAGVSCLAAIEIDSATQYAVALASCINVQSISDELQSIATRIARTANAIAAQMGGAK